MSSGPSAVSGIPDAPAAFHGPLYAHLVGLGPATGFRLPLGDDAEAAVVAALDAFLCGAEAADPASSAAPAVIAARRRLFGDPDADSEDKDLPLEYRKTQMGKACGHVFKKGEAVWRCRTCALDDTCVFCSRCFHNSNHEGHETSFSITSGGGGCCDCGDKEAWKIDSGCKYHSLSAATDPKLAEKLAIPLEPELVETIDRTVATVLDFTLYALAKSPLHPQPSPSSAPEIAAKNYFMVSNKEYNLILWNDESHTFEDVIRVLSTHLTNQDRQAAKRIAESVDARGRAIISTSTNLSRLLQTLNGIANDSQRSGTGLQSIFARKPPLVLTIQPLPQTFLEEIAHVCFRWIRTLGNRIVDLRGEEAVRKAICRELGVGHWRILPKTSDLTSVRFVDEKEMNSNFVVFREEQRQEQTAARAQSDAPPPLEDIDSSGSDSDSDSGAQPPPPPAAPVAIPQPVPVPVAAAAPAPPAPELPMPGLSPPSPGLEANMADEDLDSIDGVSEEDLEGDGEEEEEDEDQDDDDDEYYTDEEPESDDEDAMDMDMEDVVALPGGLQALQELMAAAGAGPEDDESDGEGSDLDEADIQGMQDAAMAVDMAFPPGGVGGGPGSTTTEPVPHLNSPPRDPATPVALRAGLNQSRKSTSGSSEFDVRPLDIPPLPPTSSAPPIARIDLLLSWDLKMWKELRLWLRELYIGTFVVTGEEYKVLFGLKFASNYVTLGASHILLDREPLQSVFLIAVQLFTVPTVAHRILQHPSRRFLAEFTTLLKSMFTMTGPQVSMTKFRDAFARVWEVHQDAYQSNQITLKSEAVRNRNLPHLFANIRYLLAAAPQAFRQNYGDHIQWILSYMKILQGVNRQKRAARQHVEFETDWVESFQMARYAADLALSVAHCFSPSRVAEDDATGIKLNPMRSDDWQTVQHAVRTVYSTLSQWCLADDPSDPLSEDRPRVLESAMSFIHPLHWMLGQLLVQMQHTAVLRSVSAQSDPAGEAPLTWQQVFDLDPNNGLEQTSTRVKLGNFQRVVLKVMRVQAFVAQIRANLWVRNGDSMRMQAYHYKYQSLREIGYDMDVHVLQAAACVLEPESFLRSLAGAFNVDEWLKGRPGSSARLQGLEVRQMTTLVEDFLELLVFVLTERSSAAALSYEDEARREIRHHLAAQRSGMTYSALLKKVSDRATESPTEENLEHQFERVLKTVATFKAPDTTRDFGVYELLDREYDAVDPWFWHYSRNERSEVSEVLKNRAAASKRDAYVCPPLSIPPNTPFSMLGDIIHDREFISMMFYSIWNCTKRFAPKGPQTSPLPPGWSKDDAEDGPHFGAVLDTTLHLCAVACVETIEGYASSISRRRGLGGDAGFLDNAANLTFDVLARDLSGIVSKTLLDILLEAVEHFGGGLTLSGAIKLKSKSPSLTEESAVTDLVPKMFWIVERIEQWGSDKTRTKVAEWRARVAESELEQGGNEAQALSEQDKKKQAAKERQAAILAQMKAQQQQFMAAQGLESESDEEEEEEEESGMDLDEERDGSIGVHGGLRERTWRFPSGTCIVCQEDANKDSELYGMLGFVQASKTARPLNPADNVERQSVLAGVLDMPASLDEDFGLASRVAEGGSDPAGHMFLRRQCMFSETDLCVTSCGHIMHSKCFTTFLRSVADRLHQQRDRNHPEQGTREFLCPMCKSLGNALLPVVASGKAEKVHVLPRQDDLVRQTTNALSQLAQWSSDVGGTRDLSGKLRDGTASPRTEWPRKSPAPIDSSPEELGSSAVASSSLRERFQQTLGQIIPSLFGPSADGGQTPSAGGTEESQVLALRSTYTSRLVSVMKEIKARMEGRRGPEMTAMELLTMLWSSFAHTIRCYEIGARGSGRVPGEPTSRGGQPAIWVSTLGTNQVTLLRLLSESILGFSNILMSNIDPPTSFNPNAVERDLRHRSALLVSQLFAGILTPAPEVVGEPLLRRDGLGLLSEIVSTLIPATTTPADENDDVWAWTRLIFLFDVVKAALAIFFVVLDGDVGLKSEPLSAVEVPFRGKDLIRWTAQQAGLEGSAELDKVSDAAVQKLMVSLLLPSLRQYALLLHARFGIVPLSGDESASKSALDGTDESEFDRLTAFLRLPSLHSISEALLGGNDGLDEMEAETIRNLVLGWCDGYAEWQRGMLANPRSEPKGHFIYALDPRVPQLLPLPNQFTTLIESSIAFVCSKCGTTPSDPALCLFCGEFVCAQQGCCAYDRQGECNLHMKGCGGEVGMFFLVKRGTILYLYRGNGMYLPMPYLDAHGESDVGLRRGRPAFFNPKKYADIRKTWLSMQIPQQIARRIESTYDMGGWQGF